MSKLAISVIVLFFTDLDAQFSLGRCLYFTFFF